MVLAIMNDFPRFMKIRQRGSQGPIRRLQALKGTSSTGTTEGKWHSGRAVKMRHPQNTPWLRRIRDCGPRLLCVNDEWQATPVHAGEEYLIRVAHSGEVLAGTRTIRAFGSHRAGRVRSS